MPSAPLAEAMSEVLENDEEESEEECPVCMESISNTDTSPCVVLVVEEDITTFTHTA